MLRNLHWWHYLALAGMALGVSGMVIGFQSLPLEFAIGILIVGVWPLVLALHFFIRKKRSHSPSNDESEVRGTARPSA